MNHDHHYHPKIGLIRALVLLILMTGILAPLSTYGAETQTDTPKVAEQLATVLKVIDEEIADAERREKDPAEQDITLSIQRVRLILSVMTATTQEAGIGFEIPLFELGADGNVKRRAVNTQSLSIEFLPTDRILVASSAPTFGLAEAIIQAKNAIRASLKAPTRFYPALVTIDREFDLIFDKAVGFRFFLKAGVQQSSQSSQRIEIEMSVTRQ